MKKTLLGGAFALALIASGCGTKLDREGTIEELMESGISRPVAECVVDDAVEELGEDRVISDDDPTPEEEAILFEILTNCLSAE